MFFSDGMRDYKTVEYALMVIAALLLAVSAFFGAYAMLVAAALLAVIVILHYMKDYVDAFLFRHGNFVEKIGVYELSGEREVAIRRAGNKYIATACVVVRMKDGAGQLERSDVEGLISRLAFPFKFTLAVERVNIKKMLDALQTRRSLKEIELTRIEDANKGRGLARSIRAKRELEILDHDIKSISTGSTPLKVTYYARISAENEKRFAAEEEAISRAKALAAALDGIMSSSSTIAKGRVLESMLLFDTAMGGSYASDA